MHAPGIFTNVRTATQDDSGRNIPDQSLSGEREAHIRTASQIERSRDRSLWLAFLTMRQAEVGDESVGAFNKQLTGETLTVAEAKIIGDSVLVFEARLALARETRPMLDDKDLFAALFQNFLPSFKNLVTAEEFRKQLIVNYETLVVTDNNCMERFAEALRDYTKAHERKDFLLEISKDARKRFKLSDRVLEQLLRSATMDDGSVNKERLRQSIKTAIVQGHGEFRKVFVSYVSDSEYVAQDEKEYEAERIIQWLDGVVDNVLMLDTLGDSTQAKQAIEDIVVQAAARAGGFLEDSLRDSKSTAISTLMDSLSDKGRGEKTKQQKLKKITREDALSRRDSVVVPDTEAHEFCKGYDAFAAKFRNTHTHLGPNISDETIMDAYVEKHNRKHGKSSAGLLGEFLNVFRNNWLKRALQKSMS